MKVLVANGYNSETLFANAVEATASDEEGYAVSRLVEDIAWLGHTKIIPKSDNEPAVLKLLKGFLETVRVEVAEL